MSGTVGGGAVLLPQPWRRSPEVLSVRDCSSPAAADDAHNGVESREKVVRIVMGSLSVLDWIRSQWLLGLFVFCIAMAYYCPASVDVSTNAWIRVLVSLSFMLNGASFPSIDRNTAARFVGPTIALCTAFVVVPVVLGVGLYTVVYNKNNNSNETHYLLAGLMCTFCLPPSAILSVAAARVSQGNEALSQYLGAIGNVGGVIASPLLMLACVSLPHSARIPGIVEVILFQATIIGPLCVGLVLQKGFAWVSHYRITGEDRDATRPNKAEMACSEVSDGRILYWRRRAAQINCVVMLVVSYFMFSSFFLQSSAPSLLNWRDVGLISCVELALFTLLCVIHWILATVLTDTPEDRIALFFSLITKSEVLAVPIILHCFHGNRQVAVLLLPSLLYHLIQVFATGLLCLPIRRWRYHYNCRPGTTLLPLRLSKPARTSLMGRV